MQWNHHYRNNNTVILRSSLTNSGAEQTTTIPSSAPPPTRAILNWDNADARGGVGNAGCWANGAGGTGGGTVGGGVECRRSSALVCVRGGALCGFFDFGVGGGAVGGGGGGANGPSVRGGGNHPNWASASDLHPVVVSRAKCPSSCSRRASFCSAKEARKTKRQALPPTSHAWR